MTQIGSLEILSTKLLVGTVVKLPLSFARCTDENVRKRVRLFAAVAVQALGKTFSSHIDECTPNIPCMRLKESSVTSRGFE